MFCIRPVGQAAKTAPSHGAIMGSIPVRVTKTKAPHPRCFRFVLVSRTGIKHPYANKVRTVKTMQSGRSTFVIWPAAGSSPAPPPEGGRCKNRTQAPQPTVLHFNTMPRARIAEQVFFCYNHLVWQWLLALQKVFDSRKKDCQRILIDKS